MVLIGETLCMLNCCSLDRLSCWFGPHVTSGSPRRSTPPTLGVFALPPFQVIVAVEKGEYKKTTNHTLPRILVVPRFSRVVPQASPGAYALDHCGTNHRRYPSLATPPWPGQRRLPGGPPPHLGPVGLTPNGSCGSVGTFRRHCLPFTTQDLRSAVRRVQLDWRPPKWTFDICSAAFRK